MTDKPKAERPACGECPLCASQIPSVTLGACAAVDKALAERPQQEEK
jgi:hypothetical protein